MSTQDAAVERVSVVVEAPRHAAIGGAFGGTPGLLDYVSERALARGTLVRVPLGRREVAGIVWDADDAAPMAGDKPAPPLKPVRAVLDAMPPLSAAWRALITFASGYYQRGLGELALAVLPPQLRQIDDTQLARRLKRLGKAAEAATTAERADKQAQKPIETPIDNPVDLTPEQAAALDAFWRERTPALLHGVTGSGKTEVYLRAAAQALERGQQVLVLVPEINLTPQLEARFAARFPGRVLAPLHSALTPAERLRHWLAAHAGTADLVLGTRLAIFASLPRLGLIVVDEEHDASFKQQEGARYSARDLAVWRANQLGIPVLLGSATPSLETWQRVREGRYRRLALPRRIGDGALPRVRLVDMRTLARPANDDTTPLAPPLLAALRERLARGEQSLLLLNRRGYAPVLHCPACGWKSGCPHCSAWRVFHKADRTLRCHHCALTERVPRACPECGNLDIAPIGRGTEKLEEQLAMVLPGARIARLDADTTRGAGELERQLAAVHEGAVDVLVGTQMLAKGHDFRKVTLVAAVNPDGALFTSDFRAPERLFALLMQAAGRAGRDAAQAEASEMWIQTTSPAHPLYAALVKHDYEAFAAAQLEERRAAGLPPFTHLALVRAEAREAAAATAFLRDAAAALKALRDGGDGAGSDAAVAATAGAAVAGIAATAGAAGIAAAAAAVRAYPPVPPAMARIADVERVQMLVESASRPALQRTLAAWLPQLVALRARHRGVIRWAVDVDPLAI